MERQIDEQFEYDGVTLEVVESGSCKCCYFFKGEYNHCGGYNNDIAGPCGLFNRCDGKSVIFKEVKE
ncbi:MAG: hypothetical protein PUD22_02575 [Erysipelotrichaceae bacterium]|nr:hypothetical protein [Erysipelotrichaceae bacterium]